MDCRILLVDDDPHLLAALRRRLGRMYSVTAVMNAEDGPSTDADQGPYALALSDRQMRRLDCAGCPRECAPDTIRIMLTSNADPTIEERVIEEAEVFSLLTKPCPFEEIVSSIEMARGHAAGATGQVA